MIKLTSLQLSSTINCKYEDLILSSTGYPLACWTADDVITARMSKQSVWYPSDVTIRSSTTPLQLAISGYNYLILYLSSSTLECIEYNGSLGYFYEPVVVAEGVNLFSVVKNGEAVKVAYSKSGKIYVAGRDNNSRVWEACIEVVSEPSNITSISIDSKESSLVVAYTTATKVGAYQDPETYPFPTIMLFGVPSNAVVRMPTSDGFHLVYNVLSGNRSVEHVELSEGVYTEDQVLSNANDNYNVDLFSSTDKTCIVFVEGGYVRYREWNGASWDDLVGATYIAACDVDCTPKVVYYASSTGYSRVVYRLGGAVLYAGMAPDDQEVVGTFNCSVWGGSKIVDTGNTAISSISVSNMLSQRIVFKQQEVSMGGISCFLDKRNDDSDIAFTLSMSIHYSDINGKPYGAALATATLNSADIGRGWYEFEFNLDNMLSPIDGYCFVLKQSGGNENNYASWLGTPDGGSDAKVSSDGTTWKSIPGITRSIKIRGNFNAYAHIINDDPAQITDQIVTPPAVASIENQLEYADLLAGTFEGTRLIDVSEPVYYQPGVDQDARIYGYGSIVSDWRVALNEDNLLLSFVVDSSGSSGWNDIFDLREKVVTDLIERLRTRTNGSVLFDFVKFGGMLINDITVGMKKRVRGVTVPVEDYDDIYGYDENGDPIDPDIPLATHLASGVVGWGYKSLYSGTTYKIYGLGLGWKEILHDAVTVDANWHSLWATGSPTFVQDDTGPSQEFCLNVAVTDSNKNYIRYFSAYNDDLARTYVSSDITSGDSVVEVSSTTGFAVGLRTNVLNKDYFNNYFLIDEIGTSPVSLTLHNDINYNMLAVGSVAETMRSQFVDGNWELTEAFEFFVVDENESGDIVFFVHCFDGATVEWTFTPMPNWLTNNLYYLDETARFEVDAINSVGENMPDGTKVEFYVNKVPPLKKEQTTDTQEECLLTRDGLTGTTLLYLSATDLAKLSRNTKIDVTDNNKSYDKEPSDGGVLFTFITEVNTVGGYIVISDALPENFLMSASAKILFPATEKKENNFKLRNSLGIVANLVDITPIYTGKQIDESLFGEFDRPQVSASAGADDYNFDFQRVRRNSVELLTTDSWSAIRLLPVTEDYFLDPALKTALSKSMFNLSPREQVEKAARENARTVAEGGEAVSVDPIPVETVPVEETDTLYYTPPKDFTITHETWVYDGYAFTDMSSSATELLLGSPSTSDEAGTSVDMSGSKQYLLKNYSIYTVMTFFKDNGETLAQMLLPSFTVAFASPNRITSSSNHSVSFQCFDDEGEEYTQVCAGNYAASTDEVTLTFEMEYKDFPMRTGTLDIKIYDGIRDQTSAMMLDEDIGNISGCEDTYSYGGGELLYSAKSQEETEDEYDTSVANSLLATDYLTPLGVEAEQTLTISNGVATLVLPAMTRIGVLEVHAIYNEGPDRKVVNKTRVYYKSPLEILYIGDNNLNPNAGTRYNLGAYVTWMGVDPVTDGTIVNFETSGGTLEPSISETVSGLADGVIFTPIFQAEQEASTDQSTSQSFADRLSGEKKDISRTVTISSTYQGFYASIDAKFKYSEEEDKLGDFYFYCTGKPRLIPSNPGRTYFFADGIDYTVVVGDLQESVDRGFPFIDVVGPDLVQTRMGCMMTGSGLTARDRLAKWTTVRPTEGVSADPVPDSGLGYAWNYLTANQFLGRPIFRPPSEDDGPPPCDGPECVELNVYTTSITYGLFGRGIDSYTVSFIPSTLSGSETIPKPRVYIAEPLGIDLSFEPVDRTEYQSRVWRETPLGSHPLTYALDTYSHPMNRDGKATYYCVAEVTWNDEYIFGTPSNPWPVVSLKSGKLVVEQSEKSYSYTFTEDDDFQLMSETATVSIARTTFDEDHFHECYVNENGLGQTSATIAFTKGVVVVDHTHTIDLSASPAISYESALRTVDFVGTDVYHSHTPRSVAIVECGPVINISLPLAVKGVVEYDNGKLLSTGLRVERSLDNYALSNPGGDGGEGSGIFTEKYFLEIVAPVGKVGSKLIDTFNTSVNKEAVGQTIAFHAWKQMPDDSILPLPNGTRIFASFKFYSPEEQQQIEEGTVFVADQEEVRDYAVLEVNARLSGLPVEVVASKQILIRSDMVWFPYISNPVFSKPTNDDIYLTSAFATVTEFGASQINDAITFAASRLIEAGEDYPSWKKMIVLVSDGSENLSEFSMSQAIDSVDAIDGDDQTPIFAIKLSDTESFDNLVMLKLANDTSGECVKVGQITGSVDNTASGVVQKVMESDNFSILTGKYKNVIDLGADKLYKALRFGVLMREGTVLKFRVRFSTDGINYGAYTELPRKTYSLEAGSEVEWYVVDLTSLEEFARYMEYEVTLKGSSTTFESPLFAGVRCEYYEPGRYVMFFQPQEIEKPNDYIGEMLFVHEGAVPSTSTIKYGLTHDTTSDYDSDFYSNQQPRFEGGTSAIVLSRYNEKTVTTDYKSYAAVNGGWNDAYEVRVYRVNEANPRGVIVPETSYSVDSEKGEIVFLIIQPISDEFTILVTLKQYFRVAVDMTNYALDTIVLDNVTFAYNLVDRSNLSPINDHRDVSALVKTDYSSFNITSSGVISDDYSIANSSVGSDTDIVVDFADATGRYWLMAYDGVHPYVVEMEKNLTVVKKHELTGAETSFVPLSMSYDTGNWYFVQRTESGCAIHKYDLSFAYVSSASYTVDFLDSDPQFRNIRRYNNRWYVTEKDRIHSLTRSFVYEGKMLLPFEIDGAFALDSQGLWFVSFLKDVLWGVGATGSVTKIYNFFDAQILNNFASMDDTFFTVKDAKMTRMTIS